MGNIVRQRYLGIVFFFAIAIAIYAIGFAAAFNLQGDLVAWLMPLDFTITLPLCFYLLVLRRYGISLAYLIPVIALGYGLSCLALGSATLGILPYLPFGMLLVDCTIAMRVISKLRKIYRNAKTASNDPARWIYETVCGLIPNRKAAKPVTGELSLWYYLIRGSKARSSESLETISLTSYKNSNLKGLMFGLAFASAIEIVVVHVLLMDISLILATVITVVSVYSMLWLVGHVRMVELRPTVIENETLKIRCGVFSQADIPLAKIESILSNMPDLSKDEISDQRTLMQSNVWIVSKDEIILETLFGTRRIKAIGITLDEPKKLTDAWLTHKAS